MLCSGSASAKTCGKMASIVFIRTRYLVMENVSRMSESVLFSLHGCQSPWILFILRFSVSTDSCNYGHDTLGDLCHENNDIKNKLFIYIPLCCHSSLLNGQVKFYILARLQPLWIPDPMYELMLESNCV